MPDLYKKGKKVGHISYDQPQGEIDAKVQKARKSGLPASTFNKQMSLSYTLVHGFPKEKGAFLAVMPNFLRDILTKK